MTSAKYLDAVAFRKELKVPRRHSAALTPQSDESTSRSGRSRERERERERERGGGSGKGDDVTALIGSLSRDRPREARDRGIPFG